MSKYDGLWSSIVSFTSINFIYIYVFIGKPIYYLEMFLGQFTSRSSVKIYNFCPAFRGEIKKFLLKCAAHIQKLSSFSTLGIGIGQILSTVSVITYYTSLIALTVYYFIASLAKELPWATCSEEWGPDCVDSRPKLLGNIISHADNSSARQVSSSEIYFL